MARTALTTKRSLYSPAGGAPGELRGLYYVQGSAALFCAAPARYLWRAAADPIIDGKLLAATDGSLAEIEDMPSNPAHRYIRLATMVDEFCSRPSHSAIDHPSTVQFRQVDALVSMPPNLLRSQASLPLSQSLATVFDHTTTSWNWSEREHSPPVDA